MPFAASLSEHPVAADAVGEVLGTLLERHGTEPDLAVVFVSASHTEFVGEIVGAIRSVLRPAHLIGAAASSVIGGGREAEQVPSLSVFAAWGTRTASVRLETSETPEGVAVVGMPSDIEDGATLVLLADPSTFPTQPFVDGTGSLRPDLTIVGGLASWADERGCILLRDGAVHRDGAVGVVIPRDSVVGPVVSQGCRPIGEPMTVTAAERNFLLELAGKPAVQRLDELVESLAPEDRARLSSGVQLGTVVDETRDDFDQGDFLVRSVLGADRGRGVLAVGSEVSVGATVQFHVRDAVAAHQDLESRLAGIEGDGALVFTCNGRGRSLFGVDDHDATTVAELVDTWAVAGMSCAGEIGPLAGASRLHAFTAAVLVLTDA